MRTRQNDNQPAYVVTLSGRGPAYISMVSPATWHWINSPFPGTAEFYTETIPAEVLTELRESNPAHGDTINLDRQCYEAQRATMAPGPRFTNITEVLAIITKNNMTYAAEFIGKAMLTTFVSEENPTRAD